MKRKPSLFPWPLFALALLIIGCTNMCSKSHQDMSAEEVVEAYLELALNMQSPDQKEELMAFTTGELEAALAGASTETIIAAYVQPRYELKKFSLVERRDRTPRESEITFQLSYKEQPKGSSSSDEAAEIMTENTVAVIKEDGKWLIRQVIGNKTSFDFPVSDLSKITASPPQ